jgi:hypothetical protein
VLGSVSLTLRQGFELHLHASPECLVTIGGALANGAHREQVHTSSAWILGRSLLMTIAKTPSLKMGFSAS